MKNYNTFKKVTPLLLLAAVAPAMATDVNVPINFTTLPVISITPIRALDFGAALTLTAADTCLMSVADGTPLTSAQEGVDSTIVSNGSVAQVSGGELSETCDGADDGQTGIYEITSSSNADITVNVALGTTTDIAFTPIGYVTDLEDGAGDSFTREPLLIGTPALANASTALSGFSVIGTSRAVIGGTIINQVPLTAGAPYATDFNLNVVYQ
jgi:hypothetical protein